MKILDPTLLNHIQRDVTSLCWCWRIERSDGVILGFTNFDSDLHFDGVTYKAETGFTPSAIATDSTMAVNNLEVSSILDSASITIKDILGGKFDNSRINIFLVNYLDLPITLNTNSPKHLLLVSGVLGEVKNTDINFTAEVRSKAQFLSQRSTDLTSKLCRYDLGDDKCTVNLASRTHNLAVNSVLSNRAFTITNFNQIDAYFNYGKVEFTNGQNAGTKMTVATYISSTRTITLFEPLPYSLQVGDTLVAIAGCRKTTTDCQGRYANIINYGGEPTVPGSDAYFAG